MIDTSVVISAFNEEENVEELYSELTRVIGQLGVPYELLFIDDGSTDTTFELLRRFYEDDDHVRVIRFGRNFGQQAAGSAGLRLARGQVVVFIDADLQFSPSDIPKLREKLLEGHDIVYGVRCHQPAPLYRRIGTRLVNWFIRRVTGVNVPDGATSFFCLHRRLVEEVKLFEEKTRYLSGYLAWLSYGRCTGVPVDRRPRKHGTSKYTFRRLVELTVTLITHYSNAPLLLASYLGLALALCGLVVLVLSLVVNGLTVLGDARSMAVTVIGAAVLLSGVQLMCVGIVGEYIGRIYNEVRNRPSYVIREVLDHNPDADAT